MNREEAKKEIEKHYVTSVSTEDVKLIRTEVAHRVIDDVFDYFEKYENMPCEGCKWQPQVGEWCWFWNTNEMPTLEQFSKYYDLDDDLGNYEVNTYKLYQYCEPFIGELPTFLKRS